MDVLGGDVGHRPPWGPTKRASSPPRRLAYFFAPCCGAPVLADKMPLGDEAGHKREKRKTPASPPRSGSLFGGAPMGRQMRSRAEGNAARDCAGAKKTVSYRSCPRRYLEQVDAMDVLGRRIGGRPQ